MRHTMRTGCALALATTATAATAIADDDGDSLVTERVYYDAPDADGRLAGGYVMMARPVIGGAAAGGAPVVTVMDNGPPGNRIDIVLVGDGYTAGQLALFAEHASQGLADLFGEEPFRTYQTLFNAHRVDVVSNESGVDNDPVPGIFRDTPMDMGFWCGGIERLLCIDVAAAYQFASAAPDVDHVLAIANSHKYGGAGYTASDLATFSGDHPLAPELAIHELGHSLGDLADEYDYNDGSVYDGPERPEHNVSVLDARSMLDAGSKWSRWIGHPGGTFGGLVSTFEGAYYHEAGIHRPTANSKMRTLTLPFNLPSVEGLIIEIYRLVNPIDDATPAGQLGAGDIVFVTPVQPFEHDLDVIWTVNGHVVAAGVTEIIVDDLALGPGAHALEVLVRDNIEWVRDRAARDQWMSETRAWDVVVPQLGDADGDFDVDTVDLELVLAAWGQHVEGPPDFTGDDLVNMADLLVVLANWSR